MIVTVTPNPGLDLTYVLTATEADGDVRRADSSTLEASGKGVNVSRALTLAGRPSWAVFPSGGRTGQFLRALLDEEGVPNSATEQAGDVRVNTSALMPDGHTLKLNGPGSRLSPGEQDALLAATREALAAASTHGRAWLAVCGSLPPQTDPSLVRRLVLLAHEHRARCAVDASGPALAAALDAGVDLAAPNRHELGEVSAACQAAGDVDALALAARELVRHKGSHLLVSLGEDGALFTDGRVALHAWGPPLVPVNTAGAGDALLSGWLFDDDEPAERLVRAVRWGRSACLSPTTVDARPGARDDAPVEVRSIDG